MSTPRLLRTDAVAGEPNDADRSFDLMVLLILGCVGGLVGLRCCRFHGQSNSLFWMLQKRDHGFTWDHSHSKMSVMHVVRLAFKSSAGT